MKKNVISTITKSLPIEFSSLVNYSLLVTLCYINLFIIKKHCSVLIALFTFSFAAVAQPNNNNKIPEPKNIVVFWAKEFGKDPM